MDIPRPSRTLNLTAKLKDTANTEMPQLSFKHKAVEDFHSRQADKDNLPTSSTVGADSDAPSSASAVTAMPTVQNISSVADSDSDTEHEIVDCPVPCMSSLCLRSSFLSAFFTAKKRYATGTASQAKRRRAMPFTVDDVDITDAEEDIRNKGICFSET